jgi:hypothetical protein
MIFYLPQNQSSARRPQPGAADFVHIDRKTLHWVHQERGLQRCSSAAMSGHGIT